MQTVSVRTTQNVDINYKVASLGDRILAYAIDLLIIFVYFILLILLFSSINWESFGAIVAFFIIPSTFYHLVFEIFMNGQSPGKRQMNIRVIRMDGTHPTIGNYLIRWLLRLVEDGAIAVIVIAINGKGQRLGDIAAGTTVVKLSSPEETESTKVFTVTPSDHVAVFPQVTRLHDRDIEIIQQALEVNRDTGNNQPVLLAAERLKQLLEVQSDMPPVKFLYTIIKDYQHLVEK